jgi:transcriptional regulator with XRE-family HTH domain
MVISSKIVCAEAKIKVKSYILCLTLPGICFIINVMSTVSLKSPVAELGAILKIVREKLGKKQGEIASEAGISISMLSQIERGNVSASIDTLVGVCNALNLDIAELFRRIMPERQVRVFKNGKRLSTAKAGVRYEQLVMSAESSYPAEMFLLEVAPEKIVGLSQKGHEGVEMGYVLEGRATMNIENDQYVIQAGDSISFNAHVPHTLHNTGTEIFKAVWTVVPPHKDYFDIQKG